MTLWGPGRVRRAHSPRERRHSVHRVGKPASRGPVTAAAWSQYPSPRPPAATPSRRARGSPFGVTWGLTRLSRHGPFRPHPNRRPTTLRTLRWYARFGAFLHARRFLISVAGTSMSAGPPPLPPSILMMSPGLSGGDRGRRPPPVTHVGDMNPFVVTESARSVLRPGIPEARALAAPVSAASRASPGRPWAPRRGITIHVSGTILPSFTALTRPPRASRRSAGPRFATRSGP